MTNFTKEKDRMLKKILKWVGIVLGGIVVLALLAAAYIYFSPEERANRTYTIKPEKVEIPTDAASIAEGKRLVTIAACDGCHGKDLSGQAMFDDPAVGKVYSMNLTSGKGGVGATFTDEDWVRAIRHGVKPDGHPVQVMPAWEFYAYPDADLGKMIAYLKTLPPVDHEIPEKQYAFPIRMAITLGLLEGKLFVPAEYIPHDAPRPAPIPVAESVEYGQYLAVRCTSCHGAGFSGGPIPGAPEIPGEAVPQNITPNKQTGIGKWAKADFVKALREGKRPDGSTLQPPMPWEHFKEMTDTEIGALWVFLQSVPAKDWGKR
jgi:mono/diheme cytochrome c family protein